MSRQKYCVIILRLDYVFIHGRLRKRETVCDRGYTVFNNVNKAGMDTVCIPMHAGSWVDNNPPTSRDPKPQRAAKRQPTAGGQTKARQISRAHLIVGLRAGFSRLWFP